MTAPERPSVVNNCPFQGWHRSVVLAGALLAPSDSAVIYWPPEGRRVLRSRAECLSWLVTHGLEPGMIEEFNFDINECINYFPPVDGGPKILGELATSRTIDPLKYQTRDFYVHECCGFRIERYFDFDDEPGFQARYVDYLSNFRESVRREILAVVKGAFDARRLEDANCGKRIAQLRLVYEPRNRGIFHLRENFLDPLALNLMQQVSTARQPGELSQLTRHLDDCVSFPLFTPAFCSQLLQELTYFADACPNRNRPKITDGVVFERGILLNEMGLSGSFTDLLLSRVIRPLARVLLPHAGGASLDNHYAFVTPQTDATLHEDNSEVTLQICLSEGTRGGPLLLYGPRDTPHSMTRVDLSSEVLSGESSLSLPGKAVMYSGQELNRWEPLDSESSERMILVIWARSSAWRQEYRLCEDQRPLRNASYLYE